MTVERIYFDSSALTKRLVPEEPGAELAAAIFMQSDPAYTSLLTYVEVRSALVRRFRHRQLSEQRLNYTLGWLDDLWAWFNVIPLRDAYVLDAAELVLQHQLSGADAVHLATARSIPAEQGMTFVSWDRRQAEAAQALGFTVQPTLV